MNVKLQRNETLTHLKRIYRKSYWYVVRTGEIRMAASEKIVKTDRVGLATGYIIDRYIRLTFLYFDIAQSHGNYDEKDCKTVTKKDHRRQILESKLKYIYIYICPSNH